MDDIRARWHPKKETSELKNRVKNMTCSRVAFNIIKQWKVKHAVPLSDCEVYVFAAALRWLGADTDRWGLISKLFLPHRAPDLLRMEFENIMADKRKANYLGHLMLESPFPEESLK